MIEGKRKEEQVQEKKSKGEKIITLMHIIVKFPSNVLWLIDIMMSVRRKKQKN